MFNERSRGALIAAFLCVAACTPALAVDSGKPSAEARLASFFADKNAVGDFITKAKKADLIADPLARCLAYPDFPVQDWVEGTAKAHCENSFGAHAGTDAIEAAMKSGDFASLDVAFARDLKRHFSKSNFSEAIDDDFDVFTDSARSNAISNAWLAKSPTSAFAWVARGQYFLSVASAARAGRHYGEMDQASVVAQSANAGLAIEAFRKALQREPRLMPAYVLMARAALLDSRAEVEVAAIRNGQRVDPLCASLAHQAMWGLQPKWGGSEEEMKAYAATLEPHLRERPLLALALVIPVTEAQCLACHVEDWKQAQAVGSAAVVRSSSTETFRYMMLAATNDSSAPQLAAVVYSLQLSRFRVEGADMLRNRGELLLYRLGDTAWAKALLERAAIQDPADARTHFLLGEVNSRLGQVEAARQQYALALKDEALRNVANDRLEVLRAPFVPRANGAWISAQDAVKRAAAAGPEGFPGVFAIDAATASENQGHLYLNMFADVRDPRNITVDITPAVVAIMRHSLDGDDLGAAFIGRWTLVGGSIQHVTTGMSRFEGATRIVVSDATSLLVLAKMTPH